VKYLIWSMLTFYSTSVFCEQSLCEKTWKQVDNQEGIAPHLKTHCQLISTDESYALEVVLFSKECQRFEGGEKQDCFFVRECTGQASNSATSLTYYDNPSFLAPICDGSSTSFNILNDSSGARAGSKAIVDCEDQKIKHIKLEIDNNSLTCDFPFKK
jgi:hypothetical protein